MGGEVRGRRGQAQEMKVGVRTRKGGREGEKKKGGGRRNKAEDEGRGGRRRGNERRRRVRGLWRVPGSEASGQGLDGKMKGIEGEGEGGLLATGGSQSEATAEGQFHLGAAGWETR